NDDIQGTAAICVGSLLAACKAKKEKVSDQRIVFAGAGSAGCGIAEQIVQAMMDEGLSEAEARSRIFMIKRQGLVTDDLPGLYPFQAQLAQKRADVADWQGDPQGDDALYTVVDNARPTVLIGVSGQSGLFSERIVKRMYEDCKDPFIMPL